MTKVSPKKGEVGGSVQSRFLYFVAIKDEAIVYKIDFRGSLDFNRIYIINWIRMGINNFFLLSY